MKLACSTWMMPDDSFSAKMLKAASYGFEGVEICLLDHEASPGRIRELRSILAGNGLTPCSLIMPENTYRRSLIDRKTTAAKLELAKKALDAAAQLGCPAIVYPEYGAQYPLPLIEHPKRPAIEERALLTEYLSAVADHAAQLGAKAMIEPINRYETRFFYTLEDGKRIIDEIGAGSLFLLADFFHMNIEETSIPDAIRRCGDLILHVHLGDSNRLLPGQGRLDFRPGFEALWKIGYRGFMSLECSISGEQDAVFPMSMKVLRGAIRDCR